MNINPLKKEATKLRENGFSYNYINEKIGVSKSTLSNWFSTKPFIPNKEILDRIQSGPLKSAEKRHNIRVKEIETLKLLGARELGELDRRDLWLLGLGIYIGEGSKTYDNIRVINSDPKIIRLIVKWFKEICNIPKQNFIIRLHLYPDNDINESIEYWKNITGFSIENFHKPYIDKRENKSNLKNRKLPFGTAHLIVLSRGNPDYGVKLHRRIMGWIFRALK